MPKFNVKLTRKEREVRSIDVTADCVVEAADQDEAVRAVKHLLATEQESFEQDLDWYEYDYDIVANEPITDAEIAGSAPVVDETEDIYCLAKDVLEAPAEEEECNP